MNAATPPVRVAGGADLLKADEKRGGRGNVRTRAVYDVAKSFLHRKPHALGGCARCGAM
jgi:hypothetical protein